MRESSRSPGGRDYSTHTVGPDMTIATRRDPQDMAMSMSKKSRAVHLCLHKRIWAACIQQSLALASAQDSRVVPGILFFHGISTALARPGSSDDRSNRRSTISRHRTEL